MQVIRGLHNLRAEHRGCVATIGNFDGVHLGHQAVFRRLREQGAAFGLPTAVVTFEPQPQEYFSPESAPPRLTRLREKLQALQDAAIDRVVILEFSARLADMVATEFVQRLLVAGLAVRCLLVGDDFRFGKGRAGDFRLLRAAGERYGFGVDHVGTYRVGSERVSSTRIRDALVRGDFVTAERCLGGPYRICGRVGHGDQRGRHIGFPTANLSLHRRVSPLRGVFAVLVHGLEPGPVPGVANLGNRPTVGGDTGYLLEVHLFDFARDIYREHLQVEFRHKLRDEQRFDSFAELREQIFRDAQAARALLGLPPAPLPA